MGSNDIVFRISESNSIEFFNCLGCLTYGDPGTGKWNSEHYDNENSPVVIAFMPTVTISD